MVNDTYKRLYEYGIPTKKRVYVIAEIGINHGGDLNLAKELIFSAANAGVDAVKFQTYKTEDRAPKDNKEIFDLLKKSELSYEQFQDLKKIADSCNVDFLSTAFDRDAIDFLIAISSPIIKVSSFDLENSSLLSALQNSNSNIICSVGMSDENAINNAYKRFSAQKKISLMHCVSLYPMSPEDANLAAIFSLKKKFDCPVGYSDHTNNIDVPLYAVCAGAQIIEKHYKLDENMKCIDSAVSITEAQMKKMIISIDNIDKIMGDGNIYINKKTDPNLIFKRKN